MKWSRELRIARRSVRTAIKAASAMATARARLPASLRLAPEPIPAPLRSSSVPVEVTGFGSNPGRLTMLAHLPTKPPMPGAPLIVLLHGCGQGAAGFARDTGLGRARGPAGHSPAAAGTVGREQSWALLQLVPSDAHRPRAR